MYTFRRMMLLALALPVAAAAQDPDEILRKNTEALGGAGNWARVSNVRLRLSISEPGFEVSGTYVATRSGNMRIDIEADGQRVFSEGLQDGEAWQWTPGGGVKPTNEAGAAALRHGVEAPGRFYTLEQVRDRGALVQLVDSEGADEWRLRVTLADGSESDHYLDRESFLPTRDTSIRAFHPDGDPTEHLVENRYTRPTWVDGVMRFMRTDNTSLDTGEWLGTTVVRSVEHNVGIPAGYFRPE